MATQGPTTTAATTMAGATPAAGMTSRLAQMQMRFQQRQQQERDQRKVEMISTTKTTAAVATNAATHHLNGGSSTVGSSSTIRSSTISAYSSTTTSTGGAGGDLSASLGAGKVRQMFDERRHRVAGIDKSYPLQPIQQQQQQQQQTGKTGGSNGVSNGNSTKAATTAGLNNKTRVPPISANTKARLAMQQQRQQQQQQQENGNHAETFKVASFDDNENLLDDEKFPDTISFDDDLTLTPTPIVRKLPNVGKLNGQQQNVNSVKLKPVPGRTPSTPAPSTVKTSSSATKPVPKRAPPVLSSSSAPAAPVPAPTQSSSSPSSAKSSASRASTGKSTAMATRKPSAASSVASAASHRSFQDEPVPDGLTRCTICGRNFAEDRIEKHREICQKTKNKKRKVYDTTKHRVLGTDAEKYVLQKKKVGAAASKKSISGPSVTAAAAKAGADSKRKSDWRRKHEEFIQAIRAAKEMQAHLAKGGKLSDLPPPPPSENPDYVQCPHCSRRFNQTAAERHIPKCATMLHNKPKPTAKAKRF